MIQRLRASAQSFCVVKLFFGFFQKSLGEIASGSQAQMENDLHKGANGKLIELARSNRKKETEAERRLWNELRNRKFKGLKFRRQHPLSNYIVDFYCHEYSLAIELDGTQHQQIEQALYDKERTEVLNSLGIKVIRFTNNDVLYDTEGVLGMVANHLNPSPSPQGEGSITRL